MAQLSANLFILLFNFPHISSYEFTNCRNASVSLSCFSEQQDCKAIYSEGRMLRQSNRSKISMQPATKGSTHSPLHHLQNQKWSSGVPNLLMGLERTVHIG